MMNLLMEHGVQSGQRTNALFNLILRGRMDVLSYNRKGLNVNTI